MTSVNAMGDDIAPLLELIPGADVGDRHKL